jgi:peroxiredoxin
MVRTASTMLELGTAAPPFRLPDADGKLHGLDDFQDAPALLVAFICNHCPFVQMIRHELARFAREYQPRGLAMVGINSNDFRAHPEDAPERMRDEVRRWRYPFPYLIDEAQDVAKAYRAACTPDLYLFDRDRRLVYRGQFDAARPGSDVPVTGQDLRAAADAALAGQPPLQDQRPSLGCNIKWRAGNEPDYFG